MVTSAPKSSTLSLQFWLGLLTVLVLAVTSFDASAQNLRVRRDLEFGLMDFAPMPGRARLGTDSAIRYQDGLVGNGIGTAGRIRLAGRAGTSVDISCSETGAISNGTDTIDVRRVELIVGSTGTRPGGPGAERCQGVGLTIVQMVSGNTNTNNAFIGATLRTDGTESSGSYDTANAGGMPIIIEMVVP